MWFFILSFCLVSAHYCTSEPLTWNAGVQHSDEHDGEPAAELAPPPNARGLSGIRANLAENPKRIPTYKSDRNLCYCNYHPDICGFDNETCLKHTSAACYRFAREVYSADEGKYIIEELFGCAHLEFGSNASMMTCKGTNVAHEIPSSISCCYEGNFCNLNLTVPRFLRKKRGSNTFKTWLCIFFGFVTCATIIAGFVFCNKLLGGTWKAPWKNTVTLTPGDYPEKSPIMIDMSSGSGSGFASLNEKTVAQDLQMIDVIGRGRYGEVKRALYKGDRIVAVKSFCTKDEESWKNEKEIYQTQMLNHENILQYVAADISSEDSITRLLLITDYHEHGSLYEYLQRAGTAGNLPIVEALQLAESAACGLDHLHSRLRGTGTPVKPAIAHRDLKSKNVIVKRKGVCCIADFGLALTEDTIGQKTINVQVGTKRYMAPEVLSKTLNVKSFFDFKMADVYSFSLVIWEILRRVQECKTSGSNTQGDSGYGSSGNGTKAVLVSSGMPLLKPDAATSSSLRPIQPYDDIHASDPSLEDMRQIVCVKRIRPAFDDVLKNDEILRDVCEKVEECWSENINVRPAILGVKRKLLEAILKYKQKEAAMSKCGTSTSAVCIASVGGS